MIKADCVRYCTARKEAEDTFGDEDDDDVDDVEEDDEEDFDDEADVKDEDTAYAEYLASKQKEMAILATKNEANGAGGHDDDDEDEDDDDFESEEGVFGAEQLFETPLDQLDSYVLFSQAIHGESTCGQKYILPLTERHAGIEQSYVPLFQSLTASLGSEQQQALHTIVQTAQKGGENLKPASLPH